MRNLINSLLIAVVLLPASLVKDIQNRQGLERFEEKTYNAILEATKQNKAYAWVSYQEFNLAQAYALQRKLESLGYSVDVSPFTFWIGW